MVVYSSVTACLQLPNFPMFSSLTEPFQWREHKEKVDTVSVLTQSRHIVLNLDSKATTYCTSTSNYRVFTSTCECQMSHEFCSDVQHTPQVSLLCQVLLHMSLLCQVSILRMSSVELLLQLSSVDTDVIALSSVNTANLNREFLIHLSSVATGVIAMSNDS